jgi:hypothetical protein
VQDNIALFGDFTMKVYDQVNGENKLVRKFTKRNQITNQGREALLQLMRPLDLGASPYVTPAPSQGENLIWSLAVGTNSDPPAITDTETTMDIQWQEAFNFAGGECEVITIPPNDFHLAITKILPASVLDGVTLVEAGILTRGDDNDPTIALGRKLYARQKYSPIIKTSTMTIQFEWLLGITIQGS